MYSMRSGTPDGFQIERPRSRVSSTSPEPRSPVPKHTQILICGNDIGAFASAFTLARDGFKVILVKYGLNRNSTLSTSEIGLLNEYFNLFGSGNALSPRISRISTLGDASMNSFEKKRSLQFDGLYNIKTSDTYRFNRRQDSSNQSINQTEGALLAKAKAFGIYVLEEFNVLTVNSKSKIIFCEHTRTGEKRSIHFEYIIDSCGVSVLGGSDLKSPSSDKVRGFSLSGEWKCAKPLKSGGIDGPVFVDKLEVNGTVVGWTWVTSVSKDTLSVGIVILKKELFQMKKFSTETIDETYFRLINKAAPATKSYLSDLGARFMQNIPVTLDENLNFYVNFTTGSNVRVIGEAGLSLPLLGCGSKFSLASGISAAATIAAEIRGVDTKISELFHERFLLKLHTLLLVQNAAAFELADGSGFKMLKSWNFEALKDCFGSIEPILTLVINRLTQAGVISAYLSYSDVWIRALLFFTQPKIDSRCQTLLNDILGGEEEASLEYYVLLTILGLKETFFNLSDCLQKVTIDGISMNVENGELGLILDDAGQLEQWPANGYTELSFNSDDEISDLTTTKNSPTKKYQSNEVGSSARAAKSKHDHPSTLPYSHQLYLFRSLISQWRISEIYGFIIDTNHPVFIGSFMGLLEGSAQIVIKDQEEFEEVLKRSLSVLDHELHAEGKTVYGVTTGFGGNADTKSNDTVGVQMGLIQHLNSGMSNQLLHSNVVRGAMALRIVSMSRGYSAVRWEVVESLKKLVDSGISPCVPLRGSISASGDLMPLSYVAGLLSGRFEDDEKAAKMITVNDEVYLSGKEALQKAGIDGPLVFQAKEALALVNGTSMSCALAVKCLLDVHSLSLLTQAITAFSVEILAGHIDAFDPVVSKIRPHPGQIEVAANITHLLRGAKLVGNDKSQLLPLLFTRKMPQDRYSLRTAPQWLSPLIEAVVRATRTLEIEINSVTDNPLIDPEQQRSLHGGNFQAFAVTDVMDHIRLHLHAAGKLIFAQHCELMNPDLNQGLPANLGWGHPSTDFGHKGLDVSMASYMSELADLSSPISLFVQSAELNNQSVNSLALLSARKTERAIEVFQMMLSCLLLSLCQGADMRALEHKIKLGVDRQIAIAVGKLGITDVAHRAEVEKKAVEIFSDTVLERRELDWVDRVDAAIQNVLGIMSKSLYSNITISQLSRVGSGLRDGVLECIHMSRGEVGGGNGNQVLADGSKVLYTHIRDSLKIPMYKNESNYIFGKQLDRVLQFVTNGAELRDVLFKCFGDEFVDDVLYPVTEREEDVISAPIRVNLRDYAGKVPILPSADLATKLDAVLHSNEEMEPQTPALPRALSSVDFKYESPLIAIVGAGCRFPGDINSTTEFWNALSQGQSVITDLPTDRKSFKGVTMPLRGGFLSTTVVEGFDCPFFAMSPNEAKLMDPQQRVLLETAYSALEDAGISVNDIKGSDAGVFISARSVGHDARMSEAFGETQPRYVVTGADHSFCSGRISHTFDLKGPSFTMSSACSSGGILLDLASKSLADRQCSVAIIGAATVVSHMFAFNMLSAAGIMSQKLGRCATYDKDADGYVPTESSVCFVLKRLDDAIQNGDKIMGVLGSIANTHKGTEGLGITSPGPNATAFAIKECLKLSGLHADEIDFLEAHGTGTKAGDTLEATAIANAFSERTTPLLVGACKAGFGHTENVATLTSLLKVCLAMRHSTIPPTLLDKTRMNPEVESQFKKIQADVPTTNVPWPDSSTNGEIKRAVVMSAGLSGTVVTLSVRSASSKETDVIVARPEDDPISILTISATSLNALERQKNNYVEVLRNPPTEIMETDFIKELCVNSNVRRTHFKYRITAQAKSISELVSVLDAPLSTLVDSKPASKNVVFVFPGHGSFDRKLCQDLYRQVEAFRQSIDECDTALQNLEFSTSILDSVKGLSSELISSEFEQVILLIMQYSVAKMYQRIGIEPTCVIGHSFGEIVAATVAGGISLENAIEMMWHRQILLERPECEGRMLSVMIDIETLNALLTSSKTDLDIAAYNGINQYVLSGSIKSINEMKEYLSEKKIPFRELANIVAFHSRQVYDASVEFGDRIKEIYTPQPLNVPFVSSLEASVFEVSATIPTGHWAQHIREPVQFSEAIKNAATYFENAVVIEMGSGSIGSLAKRHLVDLKSKNAKDIKSKNQTNFLPTFPDWSSTFSTLYRFSLNIDWKSIHGKTVYGSHVELPLYPFVRNNVWDDLELIHKFRSSGMDMLPPQKEYYAVVGVGIRLPRNVYDLDKFWNLMKNDKRFLPSDLFGAQERLSFDSDFFGMDDVTAAEVSPAFRMLLETSHHALEWLNSDLSNRQGGIFVCKENDLSEFEMGILAKHLGFKNPYTQTISGERESCLSLLQAAFKTLKSGQCDVALVGSSFSMGDAEDISDDSRCEVAVSLVLKTLEDAESDRDRILCLLDGRVPECANIRDLRNQLTKQVDAFMSDVFSESGSIDMILQNLEKFDKSDAALICQKRDHPIMISQAQSFLDSALSSSLFHSIVATALMMNHNTFVGCDPELNSVVGAWENKDGKSRNALVSLKGTNGIVYGVVISQPPAKFDIPKLREFRRKTVFYSPKSYHSNNSEEQKLSLKLHSFNVDTENIRWMNDHKIASSNAAIVPGSALVNFAMRTVRSQSINVDFLKPWLNPGNNLLVDIKPKSSNQFAIGSNGTEFCAVTIQDTIATVSSENINDNLVILQFTGTNVDPQLWYESGNSAISYGPHFRLVKEVWSLPDEGVLGRISIDDAENNSFWTISPTLLDACFHLMAIVDSTGGLPAKLEGLKIRTRDGEKFPSDVWCRHIPLKSFSEKHRKASKIRVYDAESGREVLTIDRFIIQLPSSASSNAVQSFNDYSILWQRSWLPFDVHHTSDSDVKSSTLCILIGFKSEMMNYIKSLYEHTIEIDSTQDVDTQLRLLDWKQYGRVGVKRTRVTYCGSQLLGSLSLSTSSEWWNIDRAYKLIEVFKALNSLAIDESAREILSDLSTIAVLWGSTSLGPELVDAARLSVAGAILNAGTELDIPANILDLSSMGKDAFEAVEKILKTSNISSTSGWYAERNGIWYISSYKHLNSLRKVTIESQNHTNGNILIIGGVGGLSSAIAKRIISMKFAKVTLAGRRSKEDKSVKQVISELGNVQYVQLDITNAQEVMKLIRSDSYTGIINAAGVLRDSLLYRVDESSLRHVGDPKVQGSLAILEAVSKYSNLCNVIFVSSIGAGIGSRGQTSYVMSNSVMDGVATQYSKSTTKNPNVTVHSVQLGLVKGVGMAKGADLGHMMSAVTISEDQAVNVLLAYLSADQKSSGGMPVLVAPLDLPPPVVTRPRGFSVSVSQDRTSKLSENDVSEFLSEQLMIAMGFEDKPEFDVPLLQLGLDSLASVSIQRAINQNYGEDIPLQEILNGTIDSLTELIVKQCNVVTISEKTEDSHVRDSEILSPFRSSVIFDLLTYHANTRPDAAFLEYGNETKVQISYSECLDLVKTMANKIKDALQSEKITTAACIFSSSAETMITTLATWKLGIVTAMLGPNTQASLLSRQLRSVKCEAIFVLDSDYQLGLTLSKSLSLPLVVFSRKTTVSYDYAIIISDILVSESKAESTTFPVQTPDSPVCWIFSSSSVDGESVKGIRLTHRQMIENCKARDELWMNEGDVFSSMVNGGRVLTWLPFSHVMGLIVDFVNNGLFAGMTICLRPSGSSPATPQTLLDDIESVKPDLMYVVPWILNGWRSLCMTDSKATENRIKGILKSLKAIISGGAPLKPSAWEWLAKSKIPVWEAMGTSETAGTIFTGVPLLTTQNSEGWMRPLPYIEIRLDKAVGWKEKNTGLLVLKSDIITKEIVSVKPGESCENVNIVNPTHNTEGYFSTGDIFESRINPKNDQVEYRFISRADDAVLLSTGFSIAPRMFEESLVSEIPHLKHACLLQDNATNGVLLVLQLDIANPPKDSSVTFPSRGQMISLIGPIRRRTAPDLNLSAADLVLLDASFAMPLSPKGTILRGRLRKILKCQ